MIQFVIWGKGRERSMWLCHGFASKVFLQVSCFRSKLEFWNVVRPVMPENLLHGARQAIAVPGTAQGLGS